MLKATGLAKKLGHRWVLKDISLEVKAGEILGIIGPNGSGKSTLLSILSGEEKPDQGNVQFQGKPLHEVPLQDRARQLAVLIQEQVSNLSFTAEEIVLMGRHPYHRSFFGPTPEDEQIVCRVMEETETRNMKHHRFTELSGGERQRVSIARVMAQEPKLLMLDEPTTYLDVHYQLAVLDRLKGWQKESSLTVIIVLHDLNLAAQYCDSLLVLKDGRQVRNGTIKQVIEPQLVEEVYGIKPVIVNHPILHIPQVLLTANS